MKQQNQRGPEQKSSNRLETLLAPLLVALALCYRWSPSNQTLLLLWKRTSWSRGGEFGIHSVTLDGWLCDTHRLPFRLAMQYDWLRTQQTHTRTHARTHTHTHHTYTRFLLLLAAFRAGPISNLLTSSYAHMRCGRLGLDKAEQDKAFTHRCSYSINMSNYKASEQQKHAIQQQVEEGKTAQTSITATN